MFEKGTYKKSNAFGAYLQCASAEDLEDAEPARPPEKSARREPEVEEEREKQACLRNLDPLFVGSYRKNPQNLM